MADTRLWSSWQIVKVKLISEHFETVNKLDLYCLNVTNIYHTKKYIELKMFSHINS